MYFYLLSGKSKNRSRRGRKQLFFKTAVKKITDRFHSLKVSQMYYRPVWIYQSFDRKKAESLMFPECHFRKSKKSWPANRGVVHLFLTVVATPFWSKKNQYAITIYILCYNFRRCHYLTYGFSSPLIAIFKALNTLEL